MARRKADIKASQEQALAYGQRKAAEVFDRHNREGFVTADHRMIIRPVELAVILAAAYTVGAQESGGKIQRRNAPGTSAHDNLARKEEA